MTDKLSVRKRQKPNGNTLLKIPEAVKINDNICIPNNNNILKFAYRLNIRNFGSCRKEFDLNRFKLC
jgi:hypothetical protein